MMFAPFERLIFATMEKIRGNATMISPDGELRVGVNIAFLRVVHAFNILHR